MDSYKKLCDVLFSIKQSTNSPSVLIYGETLQCARGLLIVALSISYHEQTQ